MLVRARPVKFLASTLVPRHSTGLGQPALGHPGPHRRPHPAEDYATLDHLSDGRLELIIGKGGDPVAPTVFQVQETDLHDRLEEAYELLRRLWREENVTWQGRFRPPLTGATIEPHPLQQPAPRVWHGSATSRRSTELAARWGDPLYSANGLGRVEDYLELVRHYRERLAYHGHDPARAIVAVGVHSPVISTYATGLGATREYLERFFAEVAPALRAEFPTTLWE
jgi:alkanesulfonate monooxygenase SsuD/methylene tetrahydromethanopterin reductase-like flavin-dependent oxidoreductase (luciferase family)